MQKKQLNDLKESSRKTIKATIAGNCKVNDKNIDNPMSQGALIEVTSDENIIEGNISEYDYNKLKENDEVEVIPINGKDMVKEEDSKYYVFEYKDSKAVKKEVQLEKNSNSYTVISGLKSGDKIISKVKDLKDNQEIRVED